MKTIRKKIELQLKPVATEKTVVLFDLVQEELDDHDWLLEYLNNYKAPRWFEVTDFTFLE